MFRRLLNSLLAPFRLLWYLATMLLSTPQRILGLSLPARVTLFVGCVLVVLWITAFVLFLVSETRAESWREWVFLFFVLVLVVVFLFVVHRTVKFWLEGATSPFPDIDYAWKAGLAALRANGMDVCNIPIIMVLGARDFEQVKATFDASHISFTLAATPEGTQALHWYANKDAIYLVCTNACRVSRFVSQSQQRQIVEPSLKTPVKDSVTETILFGGQAHRKAEQEELPPERKAMLEKMKKMPEFDRASEEAGDPGQAGTGTVLFGAEGEDTGQTHDASMMEPPAPSSGLTSAQRQKQAAKLEYVCRLLSQARQHLCPLNAILAWIPFDVLQGTEEQCKELAATLRQDLKTIRKETQLRTTVTALVTGMESDDGFMELVRRLGAEKSRKQRFGKGVGEGNSLWVPPTAPRLEAVANSACANFETAVYELYKEGDGLTKPGNSELYALLIKIRRAIRERLSKVLTLSCGLESGESEPFMFAGCYFAATGPTGDEQAFVRSVFGRVQSMERDVAWTTQAKKLDARCMYAAWAGFAISAVLAIACVALLWFR